MATTETDPALSFGDAGLTTDIPSIAATAVMALPWAGGGDEDEAANRHGQIQEAVRVALREAGVVQHGFPLVLSPEVSDVLGLMNFETGPMAHVFRDAGRAEIPRKCEDEQAYVLHWLLGLALAHGPHWRRPAGETLTPVIAAAKAAREAMKAGRG